MAAATESASRSWSWQVATSAEAVHALLQASDAHHAATYGLPVPNRRMETSRSLVAVGAVHTLCVDGEPVAMFTLTEYPPFDQDLSIFPAALRPLYLQRMAVRPRWLATDRPLGFRVLRHAVQLAASRGADALRAEANPDLRATVRLLHTLGFVQIGPVHVAGPLRRIYVQKTLVRGDGD